MARVTHVAAAQQRYEMVPVLNADGTPKETPVMKNGQQRKTKRGVPITRAVTVADKTKPLPLRKCGACGQEIALGKPYKWIAPKSGPYGGRKLYRCAACPNWHAWEYSSSVSARVAEIAWNFDQNIETVESEDDVNSVLSEAAEAVREIAQEKEDGADNIESGFGHETSMSEELREMAQQLNDWADEIENCQVPDFPEPEEDTCEACGGSGEQEIEEGAEGDEEREPCEVCDGTGTVTPDEPTVDQIDDWRSEVRDNCGIVEECPV